MNATKTFAKTQDGFKAAQAFYATCKGDASLSVGSKDGVITVTYKQEKTSTTVRVNQANKGSEVFGITDNQELTIIKETASFIFCEVAKNGPLKISKTTKKACQWRDAATSPTFEI